MSAPRNTTHHQAHKQPKKRRSLRRMSANPTSQNTAINERGIVVDMSKSELDGIFSGLSLGELDNPQEALGRVYALAIDSVAQTLMDGLDQFCAEAAASEASVLSPDNPLSAWILQMIPRDPERINVFKDSLKTQIESMKSRIQTSMSQGMAANSDLEQMVAAGRQTGDMVRRTLADSERIQVIPGMSCHLSDTRLEELYRRIQRPEPADGIKRIKVTPLPGAFRFSMGSPTKATVAPSDPDKHSDTSNHDIDETADATEHVSSDTADCDNVGKSIGNPESAPVSSAKSSDFGAAASDVMHAVSEVSGMLQGIALEMAHVMVDAYRQEKACQSLSETLKSDPRLDDDLSDFIDSLESQDDTGDDEDREITNDELVGALDKLLAEFDLED